MKPKTYWILLVILSAISLIPTFLITLLAMGTKGNSYAVPYWGQYFLGFVVVFFLIWIVKNKLAFYLSLIVGILLTVFGLYACNSLLNIIGKYSVDIFSFIFASSLFFGLLWVFFTYKSQSVFGVDKLIPSFGKTEKK